LCKNGRNTEKKDRSSARMVEIRKKTTVLLQEWSKYGKKRPFFCKNGRFSGDSNRFGKGMNRNARKLLGPVERFVFGAAWPFTPALLLQAYQYYAYPGLL
ncbi:MAG: hypothetical protein KDJ52_19735, partial [Anaerolineae bacterium]|nr:hypothetical protein [Anaerolineae bacterium]